MADSKITIEIWSDIMCPFCYIGKRKFEQALAEFQNPDQIEITWKSFQLAPDLSTSPEISVNQYLATRKQISLAEAARMNEFATKAAAQAGLEFRFDKAVVANTFSAHQLTHFAKAHNLQEEAEEALFKAYFTEGQNIDNLETLCSLGQKIGLDATKLKQALEAHTYANAVMADLEEAQELGINAVPFFVFNRKYALSGAQEPETFVNALTTVQAELLKGEQ